MMSGFGTQVTIYFVIPFPSVEHKIVSCDYPIASSECKPESSFQIYYPFLVLNLIFWYLISCLIVFVYDKVKKR